MTRTIERSKPPYAQVADALRAEILDGSRKPGQTIPSEREIADEWGVSRATATKAVASLKSQGLVESRIGVGTTVRDLDGAVRWSPDQRYFQMKRTGRVRLDGEKSRFSIGVLKAPDDVRQALRLDPGQQAIRRGRVTSAGETVVEVSQSWFDATLRDVCPDLLKEITIPQGTTAYVAERLGVDVRHAIESVAADLADATDADHFGLELPAAVLVTRLTIYDHKGKPLTYETYRQPSSHASMYEYDL